jgi:MHS family proline/betaine transporter-like MFS transporter
MTSGQLKRSGITAIVIGNVFEWYDFAVHGYFVVIIGKLFFPSTDHVASLLAAFGVFALGFVGRIGGSFAYGLLSDRKGRGYALRSSVVLMAVATTAIGCLPPYATIGTLAPILLIVLRLFQGLSLGGEFTTSLTLLAESVLPGRRGLASGLVGGASILGFLLGSAIGAVVSTFLTAPHLEGWGWRLPFWTGALIGITAWILRRQLDEAQFAEAHSREPARAILSKLMKGEKLGMFRTFLGCALYMSGFYIPFVYLATALQKQNVSMSGALSIVTAALLLLTTLNPCSGMLADRIGARKLLILSGGSMAILAIPIFRFMETGGIWSISLGFGFLAILFAPINAVGALPLVLQFSPEVRGTAFSMSFNIAAVTFGGLAPLIASIVVRRTGVLSSCGVLLLIAASMSIWAWASARPKSQASGAFLSNTEIDPTLTLVENLDSDEWPIRVNLR